MDEDKRTEDIASVALQQMSDRIQAKDVSSALAFHVKNPLWMGSREDETVSSDEELRELFSQVLGLPVTLRWVWNKPLVRRSGQIIWLLAHGVRYTTTADGEDAKPYQVSGILEQNESGEWKWALFHGSIPTLH